MSLYEVIRLFKSSIHFFVVGCRFFAFLIQIVLSIKKGGITLSKSVFSKLAFVKTDLYNDELEKLTQEKLDWFNLQYVRLTFSKLAHSKFAAIYDCINKAHLKFVLLRFIFSTWSQVKKDLYR